MYNLVVRFKAYGSLCIPNHLPQCMSFVESIIFLGVRLRYMLGEALVGMGLEILHTCTVPIFDCKSKTVP